MDRLNIVERFTRDGVSRVVWGLSLVVAVAGLAVTIYVGRGAAEDARDAAVRRASAHVTAMAPTLATISVQEPVSGSSARNLASAVTAGILIDGRVTGVRLWAEDGRLLFSTAPEDAIGSAEALNDTQIEQALSGGRPVTVTERSTAEAPDANPELITYVPVAGADSKPGVAEIVQDIEASIGEVEHDWLILQLMIGGFALAFLLLTILSFREPVARIGAGVGFVAEMVPRGYAVIDEERYRAVNDVYDLAGQRVARLKESLRASEEARLAAEGELQRVLSRMGMPGGHAAPTQAPTVPAPVAPLEVAPEEMARMPVPEPEPPSPRVEPEPRPERILEFEPVKVAEVVPEPVAEEPEPVLEEPEPVAVIEEPEPVVEYEEPEPVVEVESADQPWWEKDPEPVVLPRSELVDWSGRAAASAPAPISQLSEIEEVDADDAAIARELLLRLMASELRMANSGADPGEVRARLARTAARKKPGGGRSLREEEPERPTPPWSRR